MKPYNCLNIIIVVIVQLKLRYVCVTVIRPNNVTKHDSAQSNQTRGGIQPVYNSAGKCPYSETPDTLTPCPVRGLSIPKQAQCVQPQFVHVANDKAWWTLAFFESPLLQNKRATLLIVRCLRIRTGTTRSTSRM